MRIVYVMKKSIAGDERHEWEVLTYKFSDALTQVRDAAKSLGRIMTLGVEITGDYKTKPCVFPLMELHAAGNSSTPTYSLVPLLQDVLKHRDDLIGMMRDNIRESECYCSAEGPNSKRLCCYCRERALLSQIQPGEPV